MKTYSDRIFHSGEKIRCSGGRVSETEGRVCAEAWVKEKVQRVGNAACISGISHICIAYNNILYEKKICQRLLDSHRFIRFILRNDWCLTVTWSFAIILYVKFLVDFSGFGHLFATQLFCDSCVAFLLPISRKCWQNGIATKNNL